MKLSARNVRAGKVVEVKDGARVIASSASFPGRGRSGSEWRRISSNRNFPGREQCPNLIKVLANDACFFTKVRVSCRVRQQSCSRMAKPRLNPRPWHRPICMRRLQPNSAKWAMFALPIVVSVRKVQRPWSVFSISPAEWTIGIPFIPTGSLWIVQWCLWTIRAWAVPAARHPTPDGVRLAEGSAAILAANLSLRPKVEL